LTQVSTERQKVKTKTPIVLLARSTSNSAYNFPFEKLFVLHTENSSFQSKRIQQMKLEKISDPQQQRDSVYVEMTSSKYCEFDY